MFIEYLLCAQCTLGAVEYPKAKSWARMSECALEEDKTHVRGAVGEQCRWLLIKKCGGQRMFRKLL